MKRVNNKKALYEKIMFNVSREVKKALNESDNIKTNVITIDLSNLDNIVNDILSWIDNAIDFGQTSGTRMETLGGILETLGIPEEYTLKYTIEIVDNDKGIYSNYIAYIFNNYLSEDTIIDINRQYENDDEETRFLTYAKYDPDLLQLNLYYEPEEVTDGDEPYWTTDEFEEGIDILNQYVTEHTNVTQETLDSIWQAISEKLS